MAQLPRYKATNTAFKGMPSLTTAATSQQIASNERVTGFLNDAQKYLQKEANKYAQDTAIEEAIRNPVTKEQFDQARNTGGNPIERFLSGGTVYNEAITKVLGQQIAGELNIELQKYQNDILEEVRLGRIESTEEMLGKLKEPIQAQVEFFNGIDPEMAVQYGANAALSARNKYLQGDVIFKERKEQVAYANGVTTIENNVNDYNNYLNAYPDATVEQKRIYKDTITKVATDTSLSMSRKQSNLREVLDTKLLAIEDEHVARDIAATYKGSEINEVLQALPKDKSNDSTYFNSKNILEQDKFISRISNYLQIENAGLKQQQREVRANIIDGESYIKVLQPIPQELQDKINRDIDRDSEEYRGWKTLETFSNNIDLYNNTPYTEVVASYNDMAKDMQDTTKVKSPEDNRTFGLFTKYIQSVSSQLKEDPVRTMTGRAGVYEPLDMSNPEVLAGQVQKRKNQLGIYGPLYGLSEEQYTGAIMTEQEVNGFVTTYMNGDGKTRVAMLQLIDQGFGDANSQALLQLVGGGLPTTAELSSYFNNPLITERFLSFDEPEEQERLNKVAGLKGTSYKEVSRAVAIKLQSFSEVVMMQNPLNKSAATEKMDSIYDALTYYSLNELQSGKSQSQAINEATKLITDTFQLQDTYFIPTIYNGTAIDPDQVAYKASRIQDIYLSDFNAVPFGSFLDIADEEERALEFRTQMIENGEWKNTADGTGLVFGIVLFGGEFGEVQNAEGKKLTFKFNDTDLVVPTTDTDITAPEGETRLERMGREKNARLKATMTKKQLEKRFGKSKR